MVRNQEDGTHSDRAKPANAPDHLIDEEQCTDADFSNETQ